MDWIASKDFPEEMKNTVRNLDSSLNEIEEIVTDLTSTPLADAHSTLKPLDKAKYDTASVYAITSLFWVYMKTKGVDPKTNGLPKELQRIKTALDRAKQISDKALAPKLNASAAQRFVRSGLWEPKNKDDASAATENAGTDQVRPPSHKRPRLDHEAKNSTL